MSQLNQPVNIYYQRELKKLQDAKAQKALVHQLSTHQILHPSVRVIVPRKPL